MRANLGTKMENTPQAQPKRLPAHIQRAVAVASLTDPKTVARVVAGRPTRAATRERIVRVLENLYPGARNLSCEESAMKT